MPTTHVLIVDNQSFPLHLRYRFAGTTPGDSKVRFPLQADIARIRPGDRIIFYLEQTGFFGTFRAGYQPAFYDDAEPTYLEGELGARLIYRVAWEPDAVFALPVSEWDALDKLPERAQEVLWSLVYRKLKGRRGCTPIFPHEAARLVRLVESANSGTPLVAAARHSLDFDATGRCITVRLCSPPAYRGRRSPLPDPLPKIASSEAALEAYFTQTAGSDPDVAKVTGPSDTIEWLGNQVYCGVGMQKIDLFVIVATTEGWEYRPVELKNERLGDGIRRQVERYVMWTDSYLPGAQKGQNIRPFVVCARHADNPGVARRVFANATWERPRIFEYQRREAALALEEIRY